MDAKLTNKIASLAAIVLLALLFFPSLLWIGQSLNAPEYRAHSALLLGFAAYMIYSKGLNRPYFSNFLIRPLPLLIFLAGLILFCWGRRVLAIDLLSCLGAGTALYGFAGFICERKRWQDAALLVLLFFACLPLSYHIETLLGFPLRMISAKCAQSFFAMFDDRSATTETILLLDSKAAHVDLPCSGVKSLWSISIFCLGLSLLEKLRMNLKWLAVFLLTLGLMLLANLARIIALVLLNRSPLPAWLKDMLHVPIGLLGFIAVAALSFLLFSKLKGKDVIESPAPPYFDLRSSLIISFLLIGLVAFDRWPLATATASVPNLITASQSGLPLTPEEKTFFLREGVQSFAKEAFQLEGTEGTGFIVMASRWRAHHHPEQCLQAKGMEVESSRTILIEDDFPVRRVSVNDSHHLLLYWFEAREDRTDDYASRMWSGILHPEKAYAMVSLYIPDGNGASPATLKKIVLNYQERAQSLLEQRSFP